MSLQVGCNWVELNDEVRFTADTLILASKIKIAILNGSEKF